MNRNYSVSCIVIMCLVLCYINVEKLAAFVPDTIPTPCNPCKEARLTWSEIPFETQVVEIDPCKFIVKYKKRLCLSDGCQELKIESVEPFVPQLPECGVIAIEDVMALVTGKMVESDAMGFSPNVGLVGTIGGDPPGTTACWRIVRPACWTKYYEDYDCYARRPEGDTNQPTVSEGALIPCDSTNCCTNVLFITVDNCYQVQYSVPSVQDYMWLQYVDRVGSDTTESYQEAFQDFFEQFSDSTCKQCTSVLLSMKGSEAPNGIEAPIPHCKFQCNEDIIGAYRKLLDKRIREGHY